MAILARLISAFAPIFLVLSPLTSYTDQILAIHRTRTSAGFSLDIPLIMLTASILKIFYWPGARYDLALLAQAVIMLGVQAVLLKVALDNRPGWRGGSGGGDLPLREEQKAGVRPWGFWRWRGQRLYWQFLLLLSLLLLTLHLLLAPSPTAARGYTALLGALGLTIEATLPLPQMRANYRSRSCKGFRLSVLANWLFGDAMKMGFFFLSDAGKVPWAFKACGCFQAACDVGLGVQYWVYGEGKEGGDVRLRGV
ncbi:hypothetical protein MMC32_002679 [Xylographa parallela]|nr:hypothetical protein [Xylographa parallela]